MSIYGTPKTIDSMAEWAELNPTDPTMHQPAVAEPSFDRYRNGFGFKQLIPRQFLNYLFQIVTSAIGWLLIAADDIDAAFTADRVRLGALETTMPTKAFGSEVLFGTAEWRMWSGSAWSVFSASVTISMQQIGNQIFVSLHHTTVLLNNSGASFTGVSAIKITDPAMRTILAQVYDNGGAIFGGEATVGPFQEAHGGSYLPQFLGYGFYPVADDATNAKFILTNIESGGIASNFTIANGVQVEQSRPSKKLIITIH